MLLRFTSEICSEFSQLSKLGYFWVSFWRQLGGNFYTDLATLVDKGSSCGYVMMKPSDAIHQSAQSSSQSTNC